MKRRTFVTLPLGAAVAATATFALVPASGASSTGRITFGVPRVVDPTRAFGEPDIKINPRTGAIDVSGPMGTGMMRSGWDISVNNGASWRAVQNLPAGAPTSLPSKSSTGPGGGDTEIAFDHTGKTYFDDLWALQCFTAATTPDDGKTVTSNPAGCSHPPADRQWYALYDPTPAQARTTTSPYYRAHRSAGGSVAPLLYLSYNDIAFGAQLDKSSDGLTFTPAGAAPDAAGSPPGVYADGTKDSAGNPTNAADTPIVVDQHTGDVLALTQHVNDNGLSLAIGHPDASGDTTFTYLPVVGKLAGNPGTLFPVLAEDSARTLYAVWSEDCSGSVAKTECYHVRYSYAPAAGGWKHWSAPRYVSPASQTALMPWVVAGGPGIVDVVWYGSDGRMDPSAVQSGRGRAWYPWLAQLVGASSARPSLSLGAASEHPSHYNSICLLGTGCITARGDRNLADFFEVALDREGRARIVFADTSNGLIEPALSAADGSLDHHGAPQDTVATQSTGVDAWTGLPLRPLAESWVPVSGVSAPAGDALVNKPLGGVEDPGADITGVNARTSGSDLVLTVTTLAGSLSSAAAAADSPFGQLTVRWQLGDTLYYATAQASALGGAPTFTAGPVGSVDLCSVSACYPHYFVYGGPHHGGTVVDGSVQTRRGHTTYTIRVPMSVVGASGHGDLLQQMMAFTSVSQQSNDIPLTKAQAEAEQGVPVVVDATRDFNTVTGASSGRSGAVLPLAGVVLAGAVGGLVRRLRRRGVDRTC